MRLIRLSKGYRTQMLSVECSTQLSFVLKPQFHGKQIKVSRPQNFVVSLLNLNLTLNLISTFTDFISSALTMTIKVTGIINLNFHLRNNCLTVVK
jgi:hypothetical protein